LIGRLEQYRGSGRQLNRQGAGWKRVINIDFVGTHLGKAEKRKQQEFFELAERFRKETEPSEVKRLGDRLGRLVFGG
jgi:hypothetical protein